MARVGRALPVHGGARQLRNAQAREKLRKSFEEPLRGEREREREREREKRRKSFSRSRASAPMSWASAPMSWAGASLRWGLDRGREYPLHVHGGAHGYEREGVGEGEGERE